MKKVISRVSAMLLAAVMILSLFACGSSENGTTAAAEAGEKTTAAAKTDAAEQAEDTTAAAVEEGVSADSPYAGLGFDLSEHRDILFYAISDRPAGLDHVLEVLNSTYLEPWLNVTLSVELLPWGVAADKYKLILAGGEKADMVFSASWMGYSSYSAQGAYIELTDEMLQKYLVYSYDDQPAISWEQAKVSGKIYGICRTLSEYNIYQMIVIRQDLLDQEGFTEDIDDLDTLYDALTALRQAKKDDTGFWPMAGQELDKIFEQCHNMARVSANSSYVYFADSSTDSSLPEPDEIEYYQKTDMFHEFVELSAQMAADGFWSPNAINETTDRQLQFESGMTGLMAWNTTINSAGKNMEDAGTGIYQIYDVSRDAFATPGSYADGMVSLPVACEDVERTLLTIDCIKAHQECILLLCGGVEGEHYVLTEDGYRELGPDAADYEWGCWNWCLQNNNEPKLYTDDERQNYYIDHAKAKHLDLDVAGFVFDENPVADELTVLNATVTEYNTNFRLGMFGQGEELEAAYEDYMARLDESYLDVVMEEVRSQYTEYYNNFNK